jgi:uncharacterized membrane protein YbhN (UPF0104 family)
MDRFSDLLGSFAGHFEHVDVRFVALAFAFHVANHLLRSVAWRNVLAAAYPSTRVPLLDVTASYAVGVALNAVMPGRGGDAAKIALVRTRISGSHVATIASSMTVVVLFDLVAATVLVLGVALTGAIPFAPKVPFATLPAAVAHHAVVALVATVGTVAVGTLLVRRLHGPLRRLWGDARQGGAILHTPARYGREVAAVQAGAWGCRIMVVYLLLQAFGLPASLPTAALVMVLCGASTIVPLTPGGAGTQQVLVTYALGQAASAALVLSFSVGMQAGVTAVNGVLGLAAAMIAFRTLHPVAAVRSGLHLARAER